MKCWLLALGVLPAVAIIGATPARTEPVRDCATVGATDHGVATDCRAISTDRAGLAFESHTRPASPSQDPQSYLTTVSVLRGHDEPQVITEKTYSDSGPRYLLRDLDGDGRDELLVVTGTGGTGGDTMAVWRATGDSTVFARAGELFGYRKLWNTADGFIAQYTHSGAAAGTVSLYRFVADKLVKVAALDVQTADWPDSPPAHQWQVNDGTKCAISTDDYPPGSLSARNQALRAAGIDPATAQQRFCSEPWASFYR